MRILIFGAGAVGQAIGCMLAVSGNTVDMIVRVRYYDAISAGGLQVNGIFGEYQTSPGQIGVYRTADEAAENSYDYALITTKSYDTETAAKELLKLRTQSFSVVSMQNGCGNLEIVERYFNTDRILGARVITGFEIETPGRIRITVTADDIHVGNYSEGDISAEAEEFAASVRGAGLPCVTTSRIRRDLLAKLLYNCALNPLGALLGVHYGALGDDLHTREIMDTVIDEVYAVIDAMDEQTVWETAGEYRRYFYGTQIPATYDHRPSMLQDLENGKKTEIDALNGYVSRQGKKYGVATPVCDMLTLMVHFRECKQAEEK